MREVEKYCQNNLSGNVKEPAKELKKNGRASGGIITGIRKSWKVRGEEAELE